MTVDIKTSNSYLCLMTLFFLQCLNTFTEKNHPNFLYKFLVENYTFAEIKSPEVRII